MMDFLSIALISLLGAISPGPDFAIVTRYALSGSRRSAIYASLGVASAILVHVTYSSLGIGILLVQTPKVFHFIQILGACYLGYLGVKLLIASKQAMDEKPIKAKEAFISGFLTNILNPKAALFIMSLLARFANASTPIYVLAWYGIIISMTALVWFSSLSYFITHKRFRPHFKVFQQALIKVMGVLLIVLAITIFTSTFL